MNFNYAVAAFIAFVVCGTVGTFIYLKGRNLLADRYYSFLSFSLALWAVGFFMHSVVTEPSQCLFWGRFSHVGASFMPVFYSLFVFYLVKPDIHIKLFIPVALTVASVFSILSFHKDFLTSVSPKINLTLWVDPGLIYPIFVVYFLGLPIVAFMFLLFNFSKQTSEKRNQLIYVVFASLLGYIGGSSTFLSVFGIGIPFIHPYGLYLLSAYNLIIAYAIVRHQLMDIEVLIKKSLVFAGVFAFVFGMVVAVTVLIAQILGGKNDILTFAISALIITFTLRPIETWLVNVTDKFLFQKKYEYKQILKKFIDDVITVLNLDEVVNSTLKLLDESLHPYAASIFILNRADDKYNLYGSYGLENKDIAFTSESKLVYFLKKTHNPAVIKQVEDIKGADPLIAIEIHSLKAVLVLPFLLHDDLIGFIALGRKKSDEDYTKDDLDVLLDLARTESIAVGNAQLLTEAAQAERRAAIGTMAAGINHEIGNPLNIMSTKIQLFKMARKKGLLRDKPVEEALDQAEAALDECLKQSTRISGVTKKLSNFAKPSKEFKPQLLNLFEEIDETLSVVGYDIDIGKIKINKNFTSGSFKVLADKQEIQQVFFNILRNAAQAIDGTGMITISVFNAGSEKVRVEIQDTGKGIPEDKIHRVFEPFFTTKGASKGTGLGLSIVRQLVWRNKGEISFKSQAGAGTTFIVEFPKGE